jgi:hypothetical protein
MIRGSGIALSVVGRGVVVLDGAPRPTDTAAGVYSLDGVDCSVEPQSCVPIQDDPVRLVLEEAAEAEPTRSGPGTR